MNFKLGNKKITIFIIILALLLITGGVFWWWGEREIKGSPDDYVIKETVEGKIVENKKAGLTVKIPDGWEVERVEFEEGATNFYSQDAEVELREGKIVLPIKSGCLIQFNVVYEKMDLEQIKEEARYTHYWLDSVSEEFEEITVKNCSAIKNTFDTQKTGPGIGIYIPIKNKGYAFYFYWGPEEKEKCAQEFDKFLETVEIK